MAGRRITVVDLMNDIEKDTLFYDESGGGVTFSGGEPFMQPAFLQTLLRLCKEKNIHTAVETCGFVDSASLLGTSNYVDLYLYDLKVIDDEKHERFTGVSNKLILNNLRQLSRIHDHITIRFPVIPGVNDDAENVSRIGKYTSVIGSVEEIDVLPYHKFGIEKYRRLGKKYRIAEIQPPSNEQVERVVEKLRSYGLRVKVGG
jgi:pyruvate formate lyase activating enzyme